MLYNMVDVAIVLNRQQAAPHISTGKNYKEVKLAESY